MKSVVAQNAGNHAKGIEMFCYNCKHYKVELKRIVGCVTCDNQGKHTQCTEKRVEACLKGNDVGCNACSAYEEYTSDDERQSDE